MLLNINYKMINVSGLNVSLIFGNSIIYKLLILSSQKLDILRHKIVSSCYLHHGHIFLLIHSFCPFHSSSLFCTLHGNEIGCYICCVILLWSSLSHNRENVFSFSRYFFLFGFVSPFL